MKKLSILGVASILAVTTFGLAPGNVLAADDQNPPADETPAPSEPTGSQAGSLAETATNPLGNLVQFQMIDQLNMATYESDGPSNAFLVQAVVPVKLPFENVPLMITRTTLPLVTTPNLGPGVGRHTGLGDLVLLSLLLPKLDIKGVTIGIGPTFTFPTATSDFTGNGKWQAGPTFLIINMKIPMFQFGLLAYQQWSFAGESDRENVSKLYLQPFMTKHFKGGWYLGSQDVPWTYNFKSDKWTMPMGPKLGRVFKIGNQAVNAFGAVYYSPLNDGASEEFSFRVGLTLLFPK